MNRQMSFSESEFSSKKRVTKKEAFLAVIEEVVPWKAIKERIEPYHPKGERSRPPKGLVRMLRMLVVQNCFGLSDEGVEDAVYQIHSIRHCVGVDIGSESVQDAMTVLKFRRLLEEHDLSRAIFEEVKDALNKSSLMKAQAVIVRKRTLRRMAPP